MAACDPSTLIGQAKCIAAALSLKQILAAMLYNHAKANNMSTDPGTLLKNAACINAALTQKQILAAMLYVDCSGGGGGGSAAPDSIDYSGPPIVNPPALQNIVVDSTGRQWQFWGGAWH